MKRNQLKRLRLATGFVALSLAACSASGTNPDKVPQQNVAASVLTFTVGTANMYGTATGLNVYAAYRQPAGAYAPGDSAALVNSPTLSGPLAGNLPAAIAVGGSLDGTGTIAKGPATGDTSSLTATAQGTTAVTTFGTAGGVFSLGIEPFNYNSTKGTPATVVPFKVPLFDPAGDANAFIPWGGPPAFDPNGTGKGVRDGNVYPTGTLGVSEGLDIFYGVTPSAASPYTLTVNVPATSTTPTVQSTSASLANPAFLLPVATPPTPVLDGNGNVAFTTSFPAGVTEEYIQVIDLGPSGFDGMGCNGAGSAAGTTKIYYTLLVRPPSSTVSILNANAPKGATAAICTAAQNQKAAGDPTAPGDTFSVSVIGFDYDAYAASFPASLGKPSPPISGQTDVSVSPAVKTTSP